MILQFSYKYWHLRYLEHVKFISQCLLPCLTNAIFQRELMNVTKDSNENILLLSTKCVFPQPVTGKLNYFHFETQITFSVIQKKWYDILEVLWLWIWLRIGLFGLWSITRKKTFYATLNHLDLSFGYQTQMTFDEQTFVRHFPLVLRLIWNSLSVWIAKVGEKKHIV